MFAEDKVAQWIDLWSVVWSKYCPKLLLDLQSFNKHCKPECFFSATCDLPCGDTVSQELSEAEVDKLRMDCIFADPATDKPAILGAMSKTAAARQQWIRGEQPSITTVLDQYPRMEDMPVDIVRYLATQVCMCKEL